MTHVIDPPHPWPALVPFPHRSPVQSFFDSSLCRFDHCSLFDLITLVIKGCPVRFRVIQLQEVAAGRRRDPTQAQE